MANISKLAYICLLHYYSFWKIVMNQPTYASFLKQMDALSGACLQQESQQIIRRFQGGQRLPSHCAPVIYLVDYTRRSYVYVDEACFDLFGITARQWIEEGLEGYISRWHPTDYRVIDRHIFPDSMRFLESIPAERYPGLIFSYNYRTLNARGQYITILQRSSFIPSSLPGRPLGSIGVAFDITHFKTDLSIVHTIEEVQPADSGTANDLLYKKVHPLEDIGSFSLSKRELEILKWIAEGFSSKQIADTLCLSLNTVNNHRKNMLHKTGCKTATELLNYALKHGFL